MIPFADTVRQIEDRASKAGISISTLCKKAGVNRATWQRWKAGQLPTVRLLQRMCEALQELEEAADKDETAEPPAPRRMAGGAR